MKKINSIFLALGLLGMSSCAQDESEFFNENSQVKLETRALCLADSSVITPLAVDSNLLEMAKTKVNAAYYDENDPHFSSNMYAIRELPLTIQDRKNKYYLSANGSGKEVTLVSDYYRASQLFYLKVLPASSGIPYLIYSSSTLTPLAVGQYDNDPTNKVLYALNSSSSSLMSADWDLIPSTSYKGYFAIESQSYLGQADANNPWSVFNHVLEAKSTSKLGYGQYTKKPEQEFLIQPYNKFKIDYIEFHKEGATVTKRTPLKLTTFSRNESDERRSFTIPAVHYVVEEYSFSESSAIKIPISNTDDKFYRPIVEAERLILPLAVRPTDDPAPIRPTPDMTYSTTTKKIDTTLKFDIDGIAPPNCSIEATTYLENYNVSAKYTAYMKYVHNGDTRVAKITGTWRGIIYTTIRDDKYPKDLIKYFDLDNNSEITRLKSVKLSPIIFK